MPQAVTMMIVGSLLALGSMAYAGGKAPTAAGSLAQARRLIEANDYASAMTFLEDLLIEAEANERPAIAGLLKQAYEVLARQAETAGRDRDAAHYRDNIAILEGTPTVRDPAAKPARSVAAPATGPKPSRRRDDSDAKAIAPSQSGGSRAAVASPEPGRPPARSFEPAPPADPAKVASRESSGKRPVQPVSTISNPSGPVGPPSSGSAEPSPNFPLRGAAPATAPPESESTATGPIAAVTQAAALTPALAGPTLQQADRLWSDKKYSEAGRIYVALARENRLPDDHKKHWAYCRMLDVAQRINSRPRTAREWDEIDAEIQGIRQLVPEHWMGEYLRNIAAEARHGRGKSQAGTDKLVVRGSAPDESEDSNATTNPSWQVIETANFRIFHCNPRLAEQAGAAAERVRAAQAKRWGSPALQSPWTPRCDLYLYPDGPSLAKATGQPETAPGFSDLLTDGTRMTTRRTILRTDKPQWLATVLPHEITHVVLADLFVAKIIPRWADEGMAVLAEPDSEQVIRTNELHESLESGRVLDLRKLMTNDQPGDKEWSLYYAQSVSLTRFLVEQDSPASFIKFLRTSNGKGIDAALREVYRIGSLADLRDRWLAYARQQVSNREQVRRDPGAQTSATRVESADSQSQ
jgi:hypothetical protein